MIIIYDYGSDLRFSEQECSYGRYNTIYDIVLLFDLIGGGISTVLQQVRFASMSINQCQQSYGKNVVSNDKICPINEANRRISHVSSFH